MDLKSPEWKSQIGKDLTNSELGSIRNFGIRKSGIVLNSESGAFLRKKPKQSKQKLDVNNRRRSNESRIAENVSPSYNPSISFFDTSDL